jgi:hypothetical protein
MDLLVNSNNSNIQNHPQCIIMHREDHHDVIGHLCLKIVSYISLVLIAVGFVGNTASFLLFRLNSELRKMTSLVYLSFVAVTNMLALIVWNLNHFTDTNFNISIDYLNIVTCKIFVFIQFFSLQSSALLLSVLCVDRYVTVVIVKESFLSKLPFRTRKSAFCWSLAILIFVFLLNIHILVLNGVVQIDYKNVTNNKTVIIEKFTCYIYPNGFQLFPIWEYVHIFIQSILPFFIMILFNSLLIWKTFFIGNKIRKNNSFLQHSVIKRKRYTISLLFITITYLLFTLPTNIAYSFFIDEFFKTSFLKSCLFLLDYLSFSYYANLFLICFISNVKFRRIILKYFENCFKLKE